MANNIDPKGPRYWQERGEKLVSEGKYLEAQSAFQRAVRLDPDNLGLRLELGDALREQGRHAEADVAYEEAAALEPHDPLPLIHLGQSLVEQGQYGAAEQKFRDAIEVDPDEFWAHYDLGELLADQRKFDAAEKPLSAATILADDSDDADDVVVQARAWTYYGETLYHLGKLTEAENALCQSTNLDPDEAWPWEILGSVLKDQDKYVDAELAYKKSLELDPSNAFICCQLADSQDRQSKFSLAEENFLRANTLAPKEAHYWIKLGLFYWAQERQEEAKEYYSKALELDHDNSDVWLFLGDTFVELGDLEKAERAFLEATNINPGFLVAWDKLAHVQKDLRKYVQASETFGTLISIDPRYFNAHVGLGFTRYSEGKYSEAEKAFREAICIDPTISFVWSLLSSTLSLQRRYDEAEKAGLSAITQDCQNTARFLTMWEIALARTAQGKHPEEILSIYRGMSEIIEEDRGRQTGWEARLEAFESPVHALRRAAYFCLTSSPQYPEDGLRFAVQCKGRSFAELLDHGSEQRREILSEEELEKLAALDKEKATLERERYGWDSTPNVIYRATGPIPKRFHSIKSPEQQQEWQTRKQRLDQKYEMLFRQVVIQRPETEPFILGPNSKKFIFSLPKLQRKLRSGEAVLELLYCQGGGLLCFMVTKDGLVRSFLWEQGDTSQDINDQTFLEWEYEVGYILHIGLDERARYIKEYLTEDILTRWGQFLYGPFMDALSGVHRLWVSPHSFLTQLPFNAIPFPDGVEREVAVIPSAASLLHPKRRGSRPKPRFTLGVVAADAVDTSPLDLQTEEVRHLRGTVRSARRRWELAGNRPGEEPTLANLQERIGLTRCLVISCHGKGPNENWGNLYLGTADQPQEVNGRQLVDAFLLRDSLRTKKSNPIQVDLVVTSACLTGQVDRERPEEWLGLPLALQSVWETKTLILTLWEVEELPAMIWVVELVQALTQGLTAGEALRQAQYKVRMVTREQVEVSWLAEAQDRLPPKRWDRVEEDWQETSRTGDQRPFADPVHWAPFVLVGDPRVTISPRR